MIHRRVLVLLNRKSGTLANSVNGDEESTIKSQFAAAGVEAIVRPAEPARAKEQVAEAQVTGCTAVVVGGGDGTVSALANAVSGTDLVFAVLPLGTHNHFAKELRVPADLPTAVAAIATALANDDIETLDLAEVNGLLLLNFSGIGLHPQVVEERDATHKQIRRSALVRNLLRKFTKPLSTVIAFFWSLRRLRLLRLGITADGKRIIRTTPAVVIGNNVRQIDAFGIAEQSVCRRDVLNVYIARVRRPIALVRLLLATATGSLGKMREFECLSATDLTIAYRRPTLKVSVDGEVMQLRTPLRYQIRKGVLRVARMPVTASSVAPATETPAATR